MTMRLMEGLWSNLDEFLNNHKTFPSVAPVHPLNSPNTANKRYPNTIPITMSTSLDQLKASGTVSFFPSSGDPGYSQVAVEAIPVWCRISSSTFTKLSKKG
jgi:hypothetical protein